MIVSLVAAESTYAGTKPNQTRATIDIVDNSGTSQSYTPGKSLAGVNDPHFKKFVHAISTYILAKFDATEFCREPSGKAPKVKLIFVHTLLLTSQNYPSKPAPENAVTSSDHDCYLDSPWLKFTAEGSPVRSVRVVFFWNERQFLLDQALMSGMNPSPTQIMAPMQRDAFTALAEDYANTVLMAPSPEQREEGQISIAQRLPAEILWLFRQAWQSTFAPFPMEAESALKTIIQQSATGYTDLVKALVDRCLISNCIDEKYINISATNDLLPLSRYRIERLHQ